MALFYSVCESYEGKIGVHSYGGISAKREREYAKSGNKRVLYIGTNWSKAWEVCQRAQKAREANG